MHREPTTECGGVNKGEAPPNRGGVREVFLTQKGAHYNPPQHAKTENIQMDTEGYGAYGGVYNPWGCTNVQGV